MDTQDGPHPKELHYPIYVITTWQLHNSFILSRPVPSHIDTSRRVVLDHDILSNNAIHKRGPPEGTTSSLSSLHFSTFLRGLLPHFL